MQGPTLAGLVCPGGPVPVLLCIKLIISVGLRFFLGRSRVAKKLQIWIVFLSNNLTFELESSSNFGNLHIFVFCQAVQSLSQIGET